MKHAFITKNLINWYHQNGRELPWRETQDPYKIWLSEIILQQTRVNQGLPYYYKFVEKYPDVESLAGASEQDILRTWQGLGYYSRARNLHACAKILVDKYNSQFPKSYQKLLKLPGIGKYTAAAIASFAFREVVPTIDGNVFRVLSRLFGVEADISEAKSRKEFEIIADELIPTDTPDIFNQAMMEFGAIHCTPKNPDCAHCPVSVECYARATGRQRDFPVKMKKVKVRKRDIAYLVIRKDNMIWMNERSKGDIWQGLYDFLMVEKKDENSFDKQLKNILNKQSIKVLNEKYEICQPFKHILTHQVIFARFIEVTLSEEELKTLLKRTENGDFFTLDKIKSLPKPVLVSKYLNEAIF